MKLENIYNFFEGDIPSVIHNFIDVHDILDLNEIQILKELFSKINEYELIEKNIMYEGLIKSCITMKPKKKEKRDYIDEEKLNNLDFLMSDINTIEDGYYYKALINLIKNYNYTNYKEQTILNFLFYDLIYGKKKIDEVEKNQVIVK